jgi:hypothetical protein
MTNRQLATSAQPLSTQRDRRADGGKRKVKVTRESVVIQRRYAGVAMVIGVPVSAYRGVALVVEAAVDGGTSYRLSLAHADPDLDIVLAETRDSGAVAVDWKYWASFLDLPRLAGEGGNLAPLELALGAVTSKGALDRRRGAASVTARRPRFLTRRKQGETARMDAVFADEREIVCYE